MIILWPLLEPKAWQTCPSSSHRDFPKGGTMPDSIRSVTRAFKQEICMLPIDCITSQRTISAATRTSTTYREIAASLQHIGLIEPVVVFPRGLGDYLLLDGHLRLDILKQTGATEVRAVIST